jgi:hypothetical protein
VQGVGAAAEALLPAIGAGVVLAAWLHDVGYRPRLVDSGLHALDGARFLRARGVSPDVVALVAHHSGARFEAAERGMSAQLSAFATPDPVDLDALTMLDFTTGPTGDRVRAPDRIAEILRRYPPEHPVHRSVTAARGDLIASVTRSTRRLGLPDEGFTAV